jgi:hypothetical protein
VKSTFLLATIVAIIVIVGFIIICTANKQWTPFKYFQSTTSSGADSKSQASKISSAYLPPHSVISSQSFSKRGKRTLIDIDFANDYGWDYLVNFLDARLGLHAWKSNDNNMAEWVNTKLKVVILLSVNSNLNNNYNIRIDYW